MINDRPPAKSVVGRRAHSMPRYSRNHRHVAHPHRCHSESGLSCAFAQDPVHTDGDKYKALLENECVRVLEYRDQPGEKTDQHQHPAFVLYALSSFERTLTLPRQSTPAEVQCRRNHVVEQPDTYRRKHRRDTDTCAAHRTETIRCRQREVPAIRRMDDRGTRKDDRSYRGKAIEAVFIACELGGKRQTRVCAKLGECCYL